MPVRTSTRDGDAFDPDSRLPVARNAFHRAIRRGEGVQGVDGDEKRKCTKGRSREKLSGDPRASGAPKRPLVQAPFGREISPVHLAPLTPTFPFSLRRMARRPPKTLKNKAPAAAAKKTPRPDGVLAHSLIPFPSHRFSVLLSVPRNASAPLDCSAEHCEKRNGETGNEGRKTRKQRHALRKKGDRKAKECRVRCCSHDGGSGDVPI